MKRQHSILFFILFPGVAMLLGWGLRGYIGGGPIAAMLPGAQVALCLCLMFRCPAPFTAIVTLFAAVGIGYGGEMTYGQTIGLLRETDTRVWGLLGLTLKGGMWGLLGGAMLGLGFCHEVYGRKTVLWALLIMVVAYYLGSRVMDETMWVYFSDPEKPRFECWFGILTAALAMLVFLLVKTETGHPCIPLRFALFGLLGGAIGFGGGGVLYWLGPLSPLAAYRIGWWKVMEYTFGFFFGASLGLAGYVCAAHLPQPQETGWLKAGKSEQPWLELLVVIGVFLMTCAAIPLLCDPLFEQAREQVGGGAVLFRLGTHILYGYVTSATVILIMGLYSLRVAWQLTISFTLAYSALDLLENLSERNAWTIPMPILGVVLFIAIVAITLGVFLLRRRTATAAANLFLYLTWMGVAISFMMSLFDKTLLFPMADAVAAKGGLWAYEWDALGGRVFVQSVFTISALLTTLMWWWCRLKTRKDSAG